jgi:hypothetical protein
MTSSPELPGMGQNSPAVTPHSGTPAPLPPARRLRGFAFDPSLSIQLDTFGINEIVYKIPWENDLDRGPIGEYLEVVDYDPASACFYEPVDLREPRLIAQDGLPPSEGNPKFHQQMTYAVAMTTIRNFEKALGRRALWRSHTANDGTDDEKEEFVQRLRIYPHAMREANAYYSPTKKALLFGYFPATIRQPGLHQPGGTVFTCLSHDIIAHETTHALLDGMHRRFIELTNPDTLAFHEAFSDIVALLQHFSFPEVLRHQIARTRGDLGSANLLGQLAQEFGVAIGNYGALRDAIGKVDPQTGKWAPLVPDPQDYQTVFEPHARGSILVAAVFDGFISIYKSRVADLLRIATGGTGMLPSGALHPDLVNRLAEEAAKAARHVLLMCIRALDYCPPVDLTFGDYLRAIITGDKDLVPNDDRGYRVAFVEAFRRRGIYPPNVRNLSIDSLCWPDAKKQDKGSFQQVASKMNYTLNRTRYLASREESFNVMADWRGKLHNFIRDKLDNQAEFERLTGLVLRPRPGLQGFDLDSQGNPLFEVHSLLPSQRVGPDGDLLNQLIISITQKRKILMDPAFPGSPTFAFRGGCTMILDLDGLDLQYLITKKIDDEARLEKQRQFNQEGVGGSLRATYFSPFTRSGLSEPFALLHRDS